MAGTFKPVGVDADSLFPPRVETRLAGTYAALLTTTATKTTAYTTPGNELIPVDASGAAVTITLPSAPADKTRVTIKKLDTSTNTITIARGGSAVFNVTGGSTSIALTLPYQAVTVQYVSTSALWLVVSDDLPLTSLSQVVTPELFGAKGDNSTDDTTAINAAITAATASVNGKSRRVVLRAAATYKATQIRMKTGVTLDGLTRETNLVQIAGTTGDFIILDDPATTAQVEIANLTVNGNKANQTATNRGIYFIQSVTTLGQVRHNIRNVYVTNTKGDGIYLSDYTRGAHVVDVEIYSCDGYGLVLAGADSEVTNVDIGRSGNSGLWVPGTSYIVSNLKSWFSGQVTGPTDGHGVWVQGNRNNFSNISTQENKGYGYQLFKSGGTPTGNVLVGIQSDADNTSLSTYNGVNIFNGISNVITGVVTNTTTLTGRTQYAASVGGSNCAGNEVMLTAENTSATGVMAGTAADIGRNSVMVAGRQGRILDLTWAASQVIATPWTARTQRVTLIGNTTFTSSSSVAGLQLRLILVQDATGGRTMTFGSGFKVNWTPSTTANATNIIDFIGDGTNWLQTGVTVGL